MSDDFSDVKDAELREQCCGFLEQLRSGKPATVINMVMRSRNVGDALIARINKAAGTSGGGGGGGGGGGAAAAAAADAKKKSKEKGGVPSAPPMDSSSSSSAAADEKKKKEKKDKKDKKEKEKEKPKEEALFGDSSDEDKPKEKEKVKDEPSQALVVHSSAEEKEKERKRQKKKEKKEREAASAASSAAAGSRQDRLTSIESLDAQSSRAKVRVSNVPSSEAFMQKHLGVQPQQPAQNQQPRRASQVKLKAYDDDSTAADSLEKMYGGPEKKKKEGCVIC